MFDDYYGAGAKMGGERLSGDNSMESEKRGVYADIWDDANMMEEAPDFQGEDIYGNPIDNDGNVISDDEKEESPDVDRFETNRPVERGYGGAEKLTSYGLDTAARMYGLGAVLKVVSETDESDRDAYNPMGSIYSRLVPNPEERKNLYEQIQKDSVVSDADDDIPDGSSRNKLGIDNEGNFYAIDENELGTASDELAKRETNNAVRQMKKLLDALQNDSRFLNLRERAASEGKDVISYITSGDVSPTISTFFDKLDAESGGSVEEILDEIEKEEEEREESEDGNEEKDNPEDILRGEGDL